MTRDEFELRLGEFRARYTGKDPFGPWSDLKALYSSLNKDDQAIFDELLKEKRTDAFWGKFIELFEQNR